MLMEEQLLILKLSLFFLLSIKLMAISVLVANESINYEEKLESSKVKMINVDEIKKMCVPLTLSQLQNEEYITTHYINKGSIICLSDVKKYKDNSILFNFGDLQIERKGKIIYENDEFIRIKNLDGTIEKIYKDGRLK